MYAMFLLISWSYPGGLQLCHTHQGSQQWLGLVPYTLLLDFLHLQDWVLSEPRAFMPPAFYTPLLPGLLSASWATVL